MSPCTVFISKCKHCVVSKENVKDETSIEEPTVCVLQDKRCTSFAGVLGVWFCNCTCWW